MFEEFLLGLTVLLAFLPVITTWIESLTLRLLTYSIVILFYITLQFWDIIEILLKVFIP